MIVIDGTLTIVPSGVGLDAGQLQVGNESKPAVVQNLLSPEGNVSAVLPVDMIPQLIKGLEEVAKKAQEEHSKADIVVPGSQQEAEQMIQGAQEIEKMKG